MPGRVGEEKIMIKKGENMKIKVCEFLQLSKGRKQENVCKI